MDPTSPATGLHQNPTTRPKPKRASYAGTRTAAKSKRQGGANPSRVIYKSTPALAEEASEDERAVKKRRRVEGCEWSELARAVLRFAEVYERVESSRQAWMLELEKERLDIAREVEFERMNLLVDAQLEIARRAAARVVHDNPWCRCLECPTCWIAPISCYFSQDAVVGE